MLERAAAATAALAACEAADSLRKTSDSRRETRAKKKKKKFKVFDEHTKEMVRHGKVKRSNSGKARRPTVPTGGSKKNLFKIKKTCKLDALSTVLQLSFYGSVICGIEYRPKISFCKASLPNYYVFIRYFIFSPQITLFSYYYPGPSIFQPTLLLQLIPCSITDTTQTLIYVIIFHRGINPVTNAMDLPRLLSPIWSPHATSQPNKSFESIRDPRIRKSQLIRAQIKLKSIASKLAELQTQDEKLLKEKSQIETQLEGIRVLQGEQAHLVACYHWVGRRMKIDYDLEESQTEKNKLNKIRGHVAKHINSLTPPHHSGNSRRSDDLDQDGSTRNPASEAASSIALTDPQGASGICPTHPKTNPYSDRQPTPKISLFHSDSTVRPGPSKTPIDPTPESVQVANRVTDVINKRKLYQNLEPGATTSSKIESRGTRTVRGRDQRPQTVSSQSVSWPRSSRSGPPSSDLKSASSGSKRVIFLEELPHHFPPSDRRPKINAASTSIRSPSTSSRCLDRLSLIHI